MDMITTDEDLKIENHYSQAVYVSTSFSVLLLVYTLIAVIILRYSNHRCKRQYRYCHLSSGL